jgi:serpin B
MSWTGFRASVGVVGLVASVVSCSGSSAVSDGAAAGVGGTVSSDNLGGTSPTATGGDNSGGTSPTATGGDNSGGSPAAGAGGRPAGDVLRSNTPYDPNPVVSDADYQTFIAGTNQFGLDLFRALAPNEGNLFFSPLSTAFALAMTYAGARGNTAVQMSSVSHDTLPDATYHAAYNRLSRELATRNVAPHQTSWDGEKSVQLTLINAAWAQKDYAFVPAYLDGLSQNYDAGLRLVDFIADPLAARATINRWVSDQTANRIQDLLPPDALDTFSRLVLTNALYFYGSWDYTFAPFQTRDAAFHTLGGQDVTVPTMHDMRSALYGEGPDYQMLSLPYDGCALEMLILLPAEGAFESVRSTLSQSSVAQMRSAMTSVSQVQPSIPKFRFVWGTKALRQPLEALGMTDAFQFSIADFAGIEPKRELYLSDVYHQAFVGIDERGTEAAAASAASMKAGAMRDQPVVFEANRPFFFFIRDTSGALLFVGQLTDPAASN